MNKYLLFSGEDYYPEGGWLDYCGAFATIEEAKSNLARGMEWAQVVDTKIEKIVAEYSPIERLDLSKPISEKREWKSIEVFI